MLLEYIKKLKSLDVRFEDSLYFEIKLYKMGRLFEMLCLK